MAPTLKPVQELLQDGVVPKGYIQPKDDDTRPCDRLPPLLMNESTIDLSLLSSSPEELAKFRFALTTWGCAQVVNHGVSRSFLDEVREMSKQFFKQPQEEKEKYASKGKDLEGYGNTNVVQQGSLNWNDRLHLQLCPENERQLQYWPQSPHHFRATLEEYTKKSKMIYETLLKAMAKSLELEEERFFEFWDNGNEDLAYARFNFYPKCPISDQVVGLKPHGDGTLFSILLQDSDVEGLQVLKDDRWFRVPVIPEALTILGGDQVEIVTNGIYKSPIHKAVINPKYDRISIVMLFIPSRDKEVGPINELINEDRLQLYKKIKDYGQLYTQSIPDGTRQLDMVKIT